MTILYNCPYCRFRANVRMTEKKTRIFDYIERSGDDGILSIALQAGLGISRNTLKAHIWQINALLVDTGYHIYGRGGYYRLRRSVLPDHVDVVIRAGR